MPSSERQALLGKEAELKGKKETMKPLALVLQMNSMR